MRRRVTKQAGRFKRRTVVGLAVWLLALGTMTGTALGATLVYGNGEYAGGTGPKHFFIALERTEVESRKQAWCMNSYSGSGETVPGMSNYCHAAGGSHVQRNEQEPPLGNATAQGWVNSGSTGFIWAWAEYDG